MTPAEYRKRIVALVWSYDPIEERPYTKGSASFRWPAKEYRDSLRVDIHFGERGRVGWVHIGLPISREDLHHLAASSGGDKPHWKWSIHYWTGGGGCVDDGREYILAELARRLAKLKEIAPEIFEAQVESVTP